MPPMPACNRESCLIESFPRLHLQLLESDAPPFQIQFYPYTTLKNTIRRRGGKLLIRLSDQLIEAPFPVQKAALALLLCKLEQKPVPAGFSRLYRQYVRSEPVLQRSLQLQACRGRKQLSTSSGMVFDLRQLFDLLNREHFQGRLQVRALSWSHRRARRTLGHYDPAHRTIIINRTLDRPVIPEFVVAFVLYHEMLHAWLGVEIQNGRRRYHNSEFRRLERRFPDYDRARSFLDSENLF